ncbi:hypothetical protein C2E23DRAFT_886259 [Lenzites betulinus]|nr:hypothetical protein C2E23DRAFT_886259 [Lenzites betulinus]
MDTTQLQLPPPPSGTPAMRYMWTASMPNSGRPRRTVANPEQLVVLRALHARVGEEGTKADLEEVSRETGLEERWIRKWVKRQRSGKRRSKKRTSNPGSSKEAGGDLVVAAETEARYSGSLQTLLDDLQPAGTPWLGSGSGASPVAVAGSFDSSRSSGEYSGIDSTALRGSPLLHTPGPDPLQDALRAYAKPITPPRSVQYAQSGSSFTVPLRLGDSPHSVRTYRPRSTPLNSQAGVIARLPVAPLSCSGPDFLGISLTHLPGNRVHHPYLRPLQIAPPKHPTETAESSNDTRMFSAAPSAFSLSAPASTGTGTPTTGGAYLYQLFNDSPSGLGDGSSVSSTTAMTEPPPFSSTFYFAASSSRPENLPRDLWSPMHDFGPPMGSSLATTLTTGREEATPVSYQMRLCDLVALTKSLRGEQREDAPGSGARGKLNAGAHDGNPGTTRGGEDTEDEDTVEAVTPAEDVDLLVGHAHRQGKLERGIEGPSGCRGMADILCEEAEL